MTELANFPNLSDAYAELLYDFLDLMIDHTLAYTQMQYIAYLHDGEHSTFFPLAFTQDDMGNRDMGETLRDYAEELGSMDIMNKLMVRPPNVKTILFMTPSRNTELSRPPKNVMFLTFFDVESQEEVHVAADVLWFDRETFDTYVNPELKELANDPFITFRARCFVYGWAAGRKKKKDA